MTLMEVFNDTKSPRYNYRNITKAVASSEKHLLLHLVLVNSQA